MFWDRLGWDFQYVKSATAHEKMALVEKGCLTQSLFPGFTMLSVVLQVRLQ